MWGTPKWIGNRQDRRRFIPTHVGNTSKAAFSASRISVHPHACGEHLVTQAYVTGPAGSSPRMWGTPLHTPQSSYRNRFIPTHVGNTKIERGKFFEGAVHPHACGEHLPFVHQADFLLGSSPRMWGTQLSDFPPQEYNRFIPTHVGNTEEREAKRRANLVHPHACGEHVANAQSPSSPIGSSPRMWGTLSPGIERGDGGRFIPTHVGNTAPGAAGKGCSAVHPHACGEHHPEDAPPLLTSGSSPRMWGTPDLFNDGEIPVRFIPTHVGNTGDGAPAGAACPVHPHACGEHPRRDCGYPAVRGSSPRMWGTRERKFITIEPVRFIPTHVGNTTQNELNQGSHTVHPHACGEH